MAKTDKLIVKITYDTSGLRFYDLEGGPFEPSESDMDPNHPGHSPAWCVVIECPHPDCRAYDRFQIDQALEFAPPLPSPIDRKHPLNQCQACGGYGTKLDPIITHPGEPADPENGPSERDLPTTEHLYGCVDDSEKAHPDEE